MLTLTQRQPPNANAAVTLTLELTAEERTRSRHRWETQAGEVVFLRLPRGTVLQNGDILLDESGNYLVRVVAKFEPVLTVTAADTLELLRVAYHLGNRHVAVEITASYLRLSPDPVLKSMIEHLGLEVKAEILPFQPEAGAYGQHSHAHTHAH
ncbi:urease accessory protein UreE [Calothrix sp. PCC 6303]|uniref:urease accessory protein UreE n=1 Tax=Calothrix sp. PCC 6303 TaxID=1170562 RepID=UPI0002A00C4E|nr:urease accessory protein UreE [Calothrix sp. PCC 6303]AFY99965.1 Urease accessory protein ureE [Calothrix sp. PCC 6303]